MHGVQAPTFIAGRKRDATTDICKEKTHVEPGLRDYSNKICQLDESEWMQHAMTNLLELYTYVAIDYVYR